MACTVLRGLRRSNARSYPAIGTTGPAIEQTEKAKRVCRQCPVEAQCLEWALETRQDAGIWGGMDEEQRRTLRRARQRRRRPADG
ncbi:MAG: WhiB family transcriptional regulator [Egibacteraceae bacterium]